MSVPPRRHFVFEIISTTDRHTNTQTHRVTYGGGAHLKITTRLVLCERLIPPCHDFVNYIIFYVLPLYITLLLFLLQVLNLNH